MIGKTLAQYEIESQLGAGGMGEVYQARDTRLGRSVAIKVLPELFARDGDRIARFHREAKALASLNHPNIASLYGFEEFESTHFLVMELVSGETLAERVRRGPIAVAEALRIACQMAEALEAAHEKGVIHRDLKPANVKITTEDKVKVLDFGLAKLAAAEAGQAAGADRQGFAQSPTISMAATNAGVILGTAGYMSPEQAKGAATDLRSDIFSFGCVLYEMLTGRQPFHAETIPEILAGVLARDPDLTALPPNINPRIVALLRRCLDKNPKGRWHAAADLRVELESILADPRGLLVRPESPVVHRPLWRRAVPVLLQALAGAAVAVGTVWALKPAPDTAVTEFRFPLPESQTFANAESLLVAMSPDGSQFAYAAGGRIYLRKMNEFISTAIQGSEVPQGGPANLVFSPDGRSIAFSSEVDKAIKRILVSGGAPVKICQAENVQGMSWGPDNTILFGAGAKGIMRVAATAGTPTAVVSVGKNEQARSPQILPGSDAVLFTLATDKTSIVAQSPGSGSRKTIVEEGSDARYVPTGHLVYAAAGDVIAVPFDARSLELKGGAFPVGEGVYVGGKPGIAQLSFSGTGSLAYISKSGAQGTIIAMVDRNGKAEPIGLPQGVYETPRISPNARQIAYARRDGADFHIWVHNLDGTSSPRRLTNAGTNSWPLWAGNDQIIFQSNRAGGGRAGGGRGGGGRSFIFSQRADGTMQATQLTTRESGGGVQRPTAWAPQHQTLLFTSQAPGGVENDVWSYSFQSGKSGALVADPQRQGNAIFSPDGHSFLYESNEGGRTEIYLQPYPTRPGIKRQITHEGGTHPAWSSDGTEIFFVNGARLFSMGVTVQSELSVSTPVMLPITGFVQPEISLRHTDITPDGTHFVVILPGGHTTDSGPPPQVQVVLNWFDKVKQAVSAQ